MNLAQYMKKRKAQLTGNENILTSLQPSAVVQMAQLPVVVIEVEESDLPLREPIGPRLSRMSDKLLAEEDAIYIASLHRSCRNGRCGRRSAHQPRYKNVRRGSARVKPR